MNKEIIKAYWQQYKLLEKDMIGMSEYVTIHRKNYHNFSGRFIAMYLTVCSEIDSVANEICEQIGVDARERFGINNKINNILNIFVNLKNWRCTTKYLYGSINIVPFIKFSDRESADWWKDYNNVKHKRTEKCSDNMYNYELANLRNVLHALAALYMMIYMLKKNYAPELDMDISSALFDIDTTALK